MSNKSEAAILKNLEKLAVHNDPIDQKLYSQYDVKRGLRNANGTGVLVGLTRIGDVVGYEIKDDKKIAIPVLLARVDNMKDISIRKIIKDDQQEYLEFLNDVEFDNVSKIFYEKNKALI